MKKALRINFILPQATLSGGIKSNRLIAEAMVRRGHHVILAFVDRRKPWPLIIRPKTFYSRLVKEIKLYGKDRHHLTKSTAKLLSFDHQPIHASEVPDADITIATWWETAEWICDWPKSKGIKAYFIRSHELHGCDDPERVKSTYRLPYLKFVIARWLKQVMYKEYGAESILVPNGVDWEQFDSRPRSKGTVPTVGMLYGVQELKGASTAFEALHIVQRQIPNLRIISFGSQPISKKHDHPRGIEYNLRPKQIDIPLLYQKCDCWVVPSILKGFGMPGIEAAASHCPIVSTRCGGPEDYVQEGKNGFLVGVGKAQDMADAIIRILKSSSHDWSQMSAKSYQIAKEFNWDNSAKILEEAIFEALW